MGYHAAPAKPPLSFLSPSIENNAKSSGFGLPVGMSKKNEPRREKPGRAIRTVGWGL
jgi:hypothetical protein